MDREKVIKGFTVCSEHGLLNGEDCHGHYEYTDNLADIIKANDYSKQCPYNGCETGCVKTLAKDVFTILKEQEAVEPYSMNAEKTYGICPKCGKIIFRYGNVEENHYCGICGQAVKWE